MKILICEDEKVLADVLEEKFKEKNFIVEIARDGMEVISMAKEFKPDIIVLDILLPKIAGTDALSFLKSDKEISDIPVIVLSNLNEDKII